jgi:hypothetical protein
MISHAQRSLQKVTPEEASLDVRLAAEKLTLAAHIQSELMSIRLPSVLYARLTGKAITCRAIKSARTWRD